MIDPPQTPPRRVSQRLPSRAADGGFTLVELLIAIVLSGVIAGVTVAALLTSLNIASSTTGQVNDSTDTGLVAAFLFRDAQSAGSTDPATALDDPTLGVSLGGPDAGLGCAALPSVAVVRFSWIERPPAAPPVSIVVTYALDADPLDPTTLQLTRRICTAGASVDLVLGNHVAAATATCSPDPTCAGRPTSVSLAITGSGVTARLNTLTASLRGGTQASPASSNSSPVWLLALGAPACPNLALNGTGAISVRGDVLVDGSCGPSPISGDATTLQPTGATSVISRIADPYVGQTEPSFTCDALGTNPSLLGVSAGPDSVVVYPEAVAIDADLDFEPGHYVFCKGLTITGGAVTGTGVQLFVAGGTLAIRAGATVDLSAPPQGAADENLLIWVATPQTVVIQGGPRVSNLRGLIYAPTSRLQLSSETGANIGGLIVKDLFVTGAGAARIGLPMPARTITPATLPAGQVNVLYSAGMSASDSRPLTTWSWAAATPEGLPPGLDINNGAISGTPTAAGSYPIIVTAFDDTMAAVSIDYTITIAAELVVSGPATLPGGQVEIPYPFVAGTATVESTGGTGAKTWSATGLPADLDIDPATGEISGTPTSPGSSNVTVFVTDSMPVPVTAIRGYIITVRSAPNSVGPPLPDGQVDSQYPDTQMTVAGGTLPYSWSETGLPPGLSIDTSGVVSGTPSASGSFAVTITATDSVGASASSSSTVTIFEPPVPLAVTGPSSLPPGKVDAAYPSSTVSAIGGTEPYSWDVTGLPGGLAFNSSTLEIAGTPLTAGTFNVVVTVTDAALTTAQANYTVTIDPAAVVDPAACPATITGWRGEYYANATLAGTPTLCRDDASINFDWQTGSPAAGLPANDFSVRWTRTQDFTAGTYVFALGSDDGGRLYIDGVLAFNRWWDQGYPTPQPSFTTTLTGGSHTLVVEYYERGGDARATLTWNSVAAATCPAAPAGWLGEYYPNGTLSGVATVCRDDADVDFDWAGGSPDTVLPTDDFSVRWTRTQDFVAGSYIFHIGSDDGARLYVDGVRVFDRWSDQAYPTPQPTITATLAGGSHTIILEYYERGGAARATLSWNPSIPPSCLVAPTGWLGEYHSNNSLTGPPTMCRDDASVNFDWATGAPATGLPANDFSVRWTRTQDFTAGSYVFTIGSDDGARLYIDGVRVFDRWSDQGYPTPQPTISANLTEGSHTIVLEYYERGGDARATLTWNAFAPSCSLVASGWLGEYYGNNSLAGAPTLCRDDPSVNFNWGGGSPDASLAADDFSVRWTRTENFTAGDYVFTIGSDDGSRLYIDGVRVFDRWVNQSYPTPQPTVAVSLTGGSHIIMLEYYERGGSARATLTWNLTAPASNGVVASGSLGGDQQNYGQNIIRMSNSSQLTALSVTIRVAVTPGVVYQSQWSNMWTAPGVISYLNDTSGGFIRYTISIGPGQTIVAGSWDLIAQWTGNGTIHPTTGDTWSVTSTSSGITQTLTGTFP